MRELTESQQRAVESRSPDILTIAGAGSGKTTVLVERIQYLLDHGLGPHNICVLTFTRKAAGEMRARLRARIEQTRGSAQDVVSKLTMGTFHSIALQILRQDGHCLGYQPGISVADEDDAEMLMTEAGRDLGLHDGKAWRKGLNQKQIDTALELFYTRGHTPAIAGEEGELSSEQVKLLIKEYHARLLQMNCVDFGLILTEVQMLFTGFPAILQRYQDTWKVIMVDELQDANTIQHYGFLDLFKTSEFFGVGDRRQSIYGFRGSRPDLMTERHPTAEIIDLRECFRCGESIVQAANRLIEVNGDTIAKPMLCATGREGNAETVTGRSAAVAEYAKFLHDIGYGWEEIAVIARSHRVLKRLGQVFRDAEIPFHRVGSTFDICDAPEFKLTLAAMRLVTNPRDNLAFRRLVDALGISAEQYAAIRSLAAKKGRALWPTAIEWAEGESQNPFWELIQYGRPILDITPDNANRPPVAIEFVTMVAATLDPTRPPVGTDVVAFWERFCVGLTVEDALNWFRTSDKQHGQEDILRGRRVTLLTSHAVKGLEWPCVIIANCNEGDYPSSQSKTPESIQEERRLFYVAMTRAKERLVCHYRRPQDQAENRKIADQSRFLGEAGLL